MSSNEGANKYNSNVLYYTTTSPSNPVPIPYLYHATASRNLSTSLPTTPISTSIDVDTAYCPQCLTSWDGSTAFLTAKGRCMQRVDDEIVTGCIGCPECSAVLTTTVLENGSVNVDSSNSHVCVYKCGYCQWDSTECGVYETFDTVGAEPEITGIMKVAMKELQKQMTYKLQAKDESETFQKLQSSWLNKVTQLEQIKRRSTLLRKVDAGFIANNVGIEEKKTSGSWDVDSLENSLRVRKGKMAEQVIESINVENMQAPMVLSITDNVVVDDTCNILNEASEEKLRQQLVSNSMISAQLLPIPIALRARTVRRCLKEVESGRPGILVKPKVNPLEGDTSQRYGHGQWWKKDSSAIHSIPRIQIKKTRYNPTTNQYALLLQVKNPTLGPIRLRIHSNFDNAASSLFPNSSDIVVDSMSLQSEIVDIIPPAPSQKETFTLEAAEDSYLDMGKESGATTIAEWSERISNLDWSTGTERTCEPIVVNRDMAWVQFITEGTDTNTSSSSSNNQFIGTPLLLEIEVGEDSWESSLIRAREMENGEKDFVSFTILPVWKGQESDETNV